MGEGRPGDDLERLDARLRRAREEAAGQGPGEGPDLDPGDKPPASALGLAFRVGVELVSALAVGLGIGWLLDRWLETRPWLMLVFLLLGGAAGILNVYRLARGFGYTVGYGRKEKPGRDGSGNTRPGIEG